AGAEHDARRIDEEHLAVRLQRAEDRGRIDANDAVEDRARRVLLQEFGRLARADRERLPVDDGAGRVGDAESAAGRAEADGAVYDLWGVGIGVCLGRSEGCGDEDDEKL